MDLHEYQKQAVNYILDNKYCALFLDMGMGKTLSVLMAFNVLKQMGELEKTLIIAPLRVAQMTWSNEIDKWGFDMTYTKIIGTPKQRLAALSADTDIYITNIDNVVWLSQYWDFKFVIIDESSMFKNHQAIRFKALKKLTYKRMVLLSGTPAPNNLTEIWPQMYLLDHGLRLGCNITKFRERHCYSLLGDGHITYKWGIRDEQKIYRLIGDITMSMENIVKPKIIYNDIPVYFNTLESKAYDDFENDCYASIDEGDIDVANAAVLVGKLSQWTGGHVYDAQGNTRVTNTRKLEALEDTIQAANGENVLIFANYKHEIESIRLMGAVHLTKEIHFQQWDRGEINIAVAHPKSCGHGLNMQGGGRIIIWYSLTYSLELYLQANARLARQGQAKTVIINHLVAKDTIDESIVKALSKKEINLKALLKGVRR